MPTTTGLARITIRAPQRRLDLSVPHHVPLAELLPDLLRHAGELSPVASAVGPRLDGQPADGWLLRRGDGAALTGDTALIAQGVRDGDVLYLVPRQVTWPEPRYDDLVDEIANGVQTRTRLWDAAVTRTVALVLAGCLLLGGLSLLLTLGHARAAAGIGGLVAAVALLAVGGVLVRVMGDPVAGTAATGFGVAYGSLGAAVLASVLAGGQASGHLVNPTGILAGSATLVALSLLGAGTVGTGQPVFVAGATVGLIASVGAAAGLGIAVPGAVALVVVLAVIAVGAAPTVVVRLARVPRPVVSADPAVLAGEPRPARGEVHSVAVRANGMLAGVATGIAVLVVVCVGLLGATGGPAGAVLGGLASLSVLLRARLFPAVGTRLPLLAAGVVGLVVVAWLGLASAGVLIRVVGGAVAVAVAVALLLFAAAKRAGGRSAASPYLVRLADGVDIVVVVALVPVACVVADLYSWVAGLVA